MHFVDDMPLVVTARTLAKITLGLCIAPNPGHLRKEILGRRLKMVSCNTWLFYDLRVMEDDITGNHIKDDFMRDLEIICCRGLRGKKTLIFSLSMEELSQNLQKNLHGLVSFSNGMPLAHLLWDAAWHQT